MNIDEQVIYFNLAQKIAGLGHWRIDLQNNALFWSDEVYRIYGLDKASYTPEPASAISFYHPDDRSRYLKLIEQAAECGKDFEFSLRLIQPSGELRHLTAKGQCQCDEQARVTHIFGVFLDVTESINTRDHYSGVESTHQQYLEFSNDGHWDWYLKEGYEYMSPRFWEILGYQADEKPHNPNTWQELVVEGDLVLVLDSLQRHFESFGEHPFQQEARCRHKNGAIITVLCRGNVIEWDHNRLPVRMIGTLTNITDLKIAETRLEKNLRFQRLLMNTNTDLVFVKDDQFRIVEANTAFLSLYPESDRANVIGSTTVESYDEIEAQLFLVEDKRALSGEHSEVVETIHFPDGKERSLLTKKTRFEDENGNAFILGVARDITEIKTAEKNLIKLNEELEEFSYRTSHDLRSPLLSTRRLLDIIIADLQRGDDSKAVDYLSLARNSLLKLDTLVSDILKITYLNNEDLSLETLDVESLVDESVKSLEFMEGYQDIKFNFSYQLKTFPLLHKALLALIVENLVSNAIKYRDPSLVESRIDIDATCDGREFLLSVGDNGLGIPEKNQASIFKMFKRFHPKTSFGSGLGLYMIKKSVGKLNGTVCYQAHQKGSKFTVCIPLKSR